VLGTSIPLVRVDLVESRAFGFDQPGPAVYLLTPSGRTARHAGLATASDLQALVDALLATP
jgi:hypothetical protein